METPIDHSLWVLTLFYKYQVFSSTTTLFVFLILATVSLAAAVFYWASTPGGPAWGRHHWKTGNTLRKLVQNHKNQLSTTTPIPGPRGFPIIGSMNLMTNLAHHKLTKAAELFQAKRLMAFSLGETRFVVTCNHNIAKEILNSPVFVARPVKESAYGLMFNRAIGFAPYGNYWRTLRCIGAAHLFSQKQISVSEHQRFEIAEQMVSMISAHAENSFCVRDILRSASLNNMMCSIFEREYELGSSNEETEVTRRLVDEGYDLLAKLNWSDHLPWLAGLDFQSVRSRCSKLVLEVNRFVGRIIQEHRAQIGRKNHDFVDVLLSLDELDKLSESDMISVLWEMIFRGADNVAVLIEWILARMVHHHDVQSKVHEELDRVVGSRPLVESDIQSMVYLPAVVKEVLRLHPPGPLLSWARLSIRITIVDGYHVPAGTTAMVNMWAITRDPEVWEDPLEFKPERFVSSKDANVQFSVLGSDLRLAPFGWGTRSCPGKALGLTTVSFWVGSLLHDFKWAKSDPNDSVDLSEVLRLSCEMKHPLTVKVNRKN
ncbi:cytochrome P450 78A9-like [Prunus avium]|uniref:Cytochrome P450 78A9-like n=1 Tax=Prunus avium TaxID=42229 RepID=A0A6P5SQW0_PRUAV|nr:cytochrome P450 78A9-like [Prunus avium]